MATNRQSFIGSLQSSTSPRNNVISSILTNSPFNKRNRPGASATTAASNFNKFKALQSRGNQSTAPTVGQSNLSQGPTSPVQTTSRPTTTPTPSTQISTATSPSVTSTTTSPFASQKDKFFDIQQKAFEIQRQIQERKEAEEQQAKLDKEQQKKDEALGTARQNVLDLSQSQADEIRRSREKTEDIKENVVGAGARGVDARVSEEARESARALADLALAKGVSTEILDSLIEQGESDVDAQDKLEALAGTLIQGGATEEQVNQVLSAPDFATALGLAAGSGVLENTDTQIVQAGGRNLLVDIQTGETIKDLGASEGSLQRASAREVARIKAESPDTPIQESFGSQLAGVAQGVIDDLSGRVSGSTVGAGAFATSKIPGTAAFDFASDLATLQADIGFGILQQMRDASKTGGALGQVSERELAFLQATLGSLNQFQSEENFRKNLAKVRESIQRWRDAGGGSSGAVGQSTTGSSFDETNNTGTTSSGVNYVIE